MGDENVWTEEIRQALLAPFMEVSYRPGMKTRDGKKAIALAYVDRSDVIQRLNDVVGPWNWNLSCGVVPGDRPVVRATLTVLGAVREDFGEAMKEDEPYKSAQSDALKRVATQFGIGLYLYRMPRLYWDLDASGRFFTGTPQHRPGDVSRALQSVGYNGHYAPPSSSQKSIDEQQDEEYVASLAQRKSNEVLPVTQDRLEAEGFGPFSDADAPMPEDPMPAARPSGTRMTAAPEAGEAVAACQGCGAGVDAAVRGYSTKFWKKALCRSCQRTTPRVINAGG